MRGPPPPTSSASFARIGPRKGEGSSLTRRRNLRLLARDSYASSWQHVAVLVVIAITALVAIVPFVFAIINASP